MELAEERLAAAVSPSAAMLKVTARLRLGLDSVRLQRRVLPVLRRRDLMPRHRGWLRSKPALFGCAPL